MKKTILSGLLFSLLAISCKNDAQKSTDELMSKDTVAVSAEKVAISKDTLLGDWIVNDEYKAGFKLKADGSAESINQATLPYSKWELSGDLLQLHGMSIGNGNGAGDPTIDSLHIISVSSKELKVKNAYSDDVITYIRNK